MPSIKQKNRTMVILVTDEHGMRHVFDTAKYRIRLRENVMEFFGEHTKAFPISKSKSEEISSKMLLAVAAKNNLLITLKE